MSGARWQSPVLRVVDRAIALGAKRFGRAYATFLVAQAGRLDAAFGRSRPRAQSHALITRNRYRTAVALLGTLGYTQREIAAVLKISQAAVNRLARKADR